MHPGLQASPKYGPTWAHGGPRSRPWPKTGGRVPGPWPILARRQFWARKGSWAPICMHMYPYVCKCGHMCPYVSICVFMCPLSPVPCPMSCVPCPVSRVLCPVSRPVSRGSPHLAMGIRDPFSLQSSTQHSKALGINRNR